MDFPPDHSLAPTILVVCRANVCRSRVAEHHLQEATSAFEIAVKSAGIQPAEAGVGCDKAASAGIASRDAIGLSEELISEADLILVMDKSQRSIVFDRDLNALGKTFLLSEFAELTSQLASGAEFEFDKATPSNDFRAWFQWVVKEAYIARTYLRSMAVEIADPHAKSGNHTEAFHQIKAFSENLMSDIVTIIETQQAKRVG